MESVGRPLDDWQADALDAGMGELADGMWAADQVGLIVPRQNGKGDVLQAKALHSMYLTPVKLILWSAHEFKTVREMFLRTRATIEGCHDLSRRVKTVRTSHGEEGIELLDGTRLNFVARSRGSGRGFSPEELLWDEAYALTDEQVAAQMPSISAQPNPQIWYASSHPLVVSTVLRRICRQGRDGGDGLAYVEYGADPDSARDDPESWAESNPGYGIRITEKTIRRELLSMDADDFDRERRGIVNLDDDVDQIISPAQWKKLVDGSSQVDGTISLSLDVTPDRASSSLGVAGLRVDGLRHNEVIEERAGIRGLVDRVVELVGRWKVCTVVLDGSSPAGSLVPELEKRGIRQDADLDAGETRLVVLGSTELGRACGGWYDAVTDTEVIRHLDQEPLNAALVGAKSRDLGDGGWRFSRKDSSINISPLMTVVLADYGFALFEAERQEEAPVPFAAWGGG